MTCKSLRERGRRGTWSPAVNSACLSTVENLLIPKDDVTSPVLAPSREHCSSLFTLRTDDEGDLLSSAHASETKLGAKSQPIIRHVLR